MPKLPPAPSGSERLEGGPRDEELVASVPVGAEGLSRFVPIEGEAAFQAAGDLGMTALPGSPRRERLDS